MKLYEVIKTYYVVAEDELEAEYLRPEMDACDTELHKIESPTEILANWQDAIPFGEHGTDKTCKQFAEEFSKVLESPQIEQ